MDFSIQTVPNKNDGPTIQTAPNKNPAEILSKFKPKKTITRTKTVDGSSTVREIIVQTEDAPREGPSALEDLKNQLLLPTNKALIGAALGGILLWIFLMIGFKIGRKRARRRRELENDGSTTPITPRTPETPRGMRAREADRRELDRIRGDED